MNTEIEKKCIDAIRFLSIDMVQKANSGHPGAPMSLAPLAFALWKDHLNFNPDDPDWVNRDRFILSAGHASALLYSMLHLTGYDLTIDDLKNLISEHFKETESQLSKKMIENFDDEVNNFVQVCPKEMLDKLKNPITLKKDIKKVS